MVISNDIAVIVAEVGCKKNIIKIKVEDGKLYLAVVCNTKNVNTDIIMQMVSMIAILK